MPSILSNNNRPSLVATYLNASAGEDTSRNAVGYN